MKKTLLLFLLLPAALAVLSRFPVQSPPRSTHPADHIHLLKQHLSVLQTEMPAGHPPIDSGIYFTTGRVCGGCHGYDPNKKALVTDDGRDINIYDDWRTSLMALSARDPYWRAKVSQESMLNPAHSLALQDKCTACHAPAGHFQAKIRDKKPFYTMTDLYADSLGLDGVNCQSCHAQSWSPFLASQHSGKLYFDSATIRTAYGPYELVFKAPMEFTLGITPRYGEQILDAGLCAGCHTLITESVTPNGDPTGDTFIEQATYHEWLNSAFDAQHDNVTCQSCHLPHVDEPVVIAANYQFLKPQWPFGLHEMTGAGVTMLRLMRDNRQALGIQAQPQHFDSTIAVTLRMLQTQSLDLELEAVQLQGDTLGFDLKLINKTGHKFPTGYPSRRAWVEFELLDSTGIALFHSGKPAADYSLPDENPSLEPHYNRINRPDQVQIYETVPGNTKGVFTTLLQQAFTTLKDNRLPPRGFRLSDPAYDTTRIIGDARDDPDFNRNGGQEGSGTDVVHYRIANPGYKGRVSVRARVWYQSLPPKWLEPLFEMSSAEIDGFKTMFELADKQPVLVDMAELPALWVSPTVSVTAKDIPNRIRLWPTLTTDGWINLDLPPGRPLPEILVWDCSGRLRWKGKAERFQLPKAGDVYWVQADGRLWKVVFVE